MKKMKLGAFIASLVLIALNVMVVGSDGNFKNGIDLASLKLSMAIAENGTGKTKDVTTAQKLVIIAIEGGASVKVSLGDILDSGATVEGQVIAELKDCFKIDCYEGGSCACTSVSSWTICATSGCPENCS